MTVGATHINLISEEIKTPLPSRVAATLISQNYFITNITIKPIKFEMNLITNNMMIENLSSTLTACAAFIFSEFPFLR